MEEVWIQIELCPNYAVSNRGRVLNISRDIYISQRETEEGTLRVSLYDRGRQQDFYVHHLVYEAFYGKLEDGNQIVHLDGDKKNNTPENLRHRKRMRKIKEGNHPLAEGEETNPRHWGRKVMILETGEIFRTVRDCADYINADYSTIYACLRGERRSHRGFTFQYY